MKLRIFNKGNGWYVSATNYKNNTDKAYMNIHFTDNSDPIPDNVAIENSGFTFTDIDVMEAKFGAYKGKITMTIFRYEPILNGEVKGYESFKRSDVPTTIDDGDFPWE